MLDRYRQDGFIWALVFSLLVNLLFVFALLTPRSIKTTPGVQPFVISLAAPQSAAQGNFSSPLSTSYASPPAKNNPTAESSPNLQPLNISIEPALASQTSDNKTLTRPVAETEIGEGSTLPHAGSQGESTSPAIAEEIAGDMSILGDKLTGDNYTAPECLVGEKPPYPKRAERNGWQGTVLLSLFINADGEVEKVGIAKTSGYELLDQQARESISAWRYKPARRNGVAIATTVQLPVIFRPTRPVNQP